MKQYFDLVLGIFWYAVGLWGMMHNVDWSGLGFFETLLSAILFLVYAFILAYAFKLLDQFNF